jgi:hypothetical protein
MNLSSDRRVLVAPSGELCARYRSAAHAPSSEQRYRARHDERVEERVGADRSRLLLASRADPTGGKL